MSSCFMSSCSMPSRLMPCCSMSFSMASCSMSSCSVSSRFCHHVHCHCVECDHVQCHCARHHNFQCHHFQRYHIQCNHVQRYYIQYHHLHLEYENKYLSSDWLSYLSRRNNKHRNGIQYEMAIEVRLVVDLLEYWFFAMVAFTKMCMTGFFVHIIKSIIIRIQWKALIFLVEKIILSSIYSYCSQQNPRENYFTRNRAFPDNSQQHQKEGQERKLALCVLSPPSRLIYRKQPVVAKRLYEYHTGMTEVLSRVLAFKGEKKREKRGSTVKSSLGPPLRGRCPCATLARLDALPPTSCSVFACAHTKSCSPPLWLDCFLLPDFLIPKPNFAFCHFYLTAYVRGRLWTSLPLVRLEATRRSRGSFEMAAESEDKFLLSGMRCGVIFSRASASIAVSPFNISLTNESMLVVNERSISLLVLILFER